MSTDRIIRPYEADDEASLVALWNSAMWADPIDAGTWRTRYLLDPNFDANTCLVAMDPGSSDVTGFVLGMTQELDATRVAGPTDAWVVGFGVDVRHRRHGIGSALFERLERRWTEAGIVRIMVGPYVPSYVTPGVDEAAYPDAIHFLQMWGAKAASRPLSMKASLTGYRPATDVPALTVKLESSGIHVRPVAPSDILPLLQFLDRHFAHWRADAASVLSDLYGADPRSVTMHVALDGDDIIGYAQSRNERFGPFGVNETYRGRGVGAVLLSTTLQAMRARGFHCAWFLWTSDRAARLYREHGFDEVRRFALMTKALNGEERTT